MQKVNLGVIVLLAGTLLSACGEGGMFGFKGDGSDARSGGRATAAAVDPCPGKNDPFYQDIDLDGFGDPATLVCKKKAPAGYIEDGTDCDDAEGAVNPGASEVCGDALDNDCSGVADDASDPGDHVTWYRDRDADSFGDSILAEPVVSCAEPDTVGFWALFQGDCNDDNSDIYPGAPEVCNDNADNDCNGYVDEGATTVYVDFDLDGFGGAEVVNNTCVGDDEYPAEAIAQGGDCNDGSEFVYPGAEEACNGFDDDCNGLVDSDELTSLATGTVSYYEDADYDGYGNPAVSFLGCDLRPTDSGTGSRWVRDATDCDDTVATQTGECPPAFMFAMMAAPSICPETGDPPDLYWQDNDADGYGNPLVTTELCAAACNAEEGCWSLPSAGADCDDENGLIHPDFAGSGWVDICNNDVDDDCDGYIDENETPDRVFVDIDRDGYGGDEVFNNSCEGDAGRPVYAHPIQADCNDASTSIQPGGGEICDGLDNNCNGRLDSNDDSLIDPSFSLSATPYWTDEVDLDGWGDITQPFIILCPMPPDTYARADGIWAGNQDDCDPLNYNVIACEE